MVIPEWLKALLVCIILVPVSFFAGQIFGTILDCIWPLNILKIVAILVGGALIVSYIHKHYSKIWIAVSIVVIIVLVLGTSTGTGYFPGGCDYGYDPKTIQSQIYWREEVKPFAILEHTQSGSNLKFVVQNVEADSMSIDTINVSWQGSTVGVTPLSPDFSPSEKKTISITNLSPCVPGGTYEYRVNFTYSGINSSEQKTEVGAKTLVGKCS